LQTGSKRRKQAGETSGAKDPAALLRCCPAPRLAELRGVIGIGDAAWAQANSPCVTLMQLF
jgi:hypothetical protein